MIYLDASAAAKALVEEPETSTIVGAFGAGAEFVASRLLAVELHAVADRRSLNHESADDLLDRVALVSLDDDTMTRAIRLRTGLRTLDALHLATALELSDVVTSFLTYDKELAAAARAHGLTPADLP
ncbi:type II toxin-antitoxin system VapC family toxin [Microbacterium sp. PF5]|uniref:type II toxin-antitoxin system VapC family toxin n=1 Tax=Microbacterium sp. PF5 TaxID=2305435 RepID=UPI00109BD26E|nr:type II toxin-antitoxin system VapC family toxin [Microbacterium sp. PF5]